MQVTFPSTITFKSYSALKFTMCAAWISQMRTNPTLFKLKLWPKSITFVHTKWSWNTGNQNQNNNVFSYSSCLDNWWVGVPCIDVTLEHIWWHGRPCHTVDMYNNLGRGSLNGTDAGRRGQRSQIRIWFSSLPPSLRLSHNSSNTACVLDFIQSPGKNRLHAAWRMEASWGVYHWDSNRCLFCR